MSIHSTTMMISVIAALFTAVFLLDILGSLGLPLPVFYAVPLALTPLLRRLEATNKEAHGAMNNERHVCERRRYDEAAVSCGSEAGGLFQQSARLRIWN